MRGAFAWVLTVGVLLAGCSLVPEPGPRAIRGPTDGYLPTASFLKVFVRTDEASGDQTLVDFDRRDWYAAGIVKALDDKMIRFVDVRGQERVLAEVLVESVEAPADLAALKYDAMRATAQQRSAMDAEYEQLLAKLAPVATPSTPSVALP